jgi:hypothetical protein
MTGHPNDIRRIKQVSGHRFGRSRPICGFASEPDVVDLTSA